MQLSVQTTKKSNEAFSHTISNVCGCIVFVDLLFWKQWENSLCIPDIKRWTLRSIHIDWHNSSYTRPSPSVPYIVAQLIQRETLFSWLIPPLPRQLPYTQCHQIYFGKNTMMRSVKRPSTVKPCMTHGRGRVPRACACKTVLSLGTCASFSS